MLGFIKLSQYKLGTMQKSLSKNVKKKKWKKIKDSVKKHMHIFRHD